MLHQTKSVEQYIHLHVFEKKKGNGEKGIVKNFGVIVILWSSSGCWLWMWPDDGNIAVHIGEFLDMYILRCLNNVQ